MALKVWFELDLGQKIGQMRAVSVNMRGQEANAILCAYSADFDVDPYCEMFFFPTDTLKLALLSLDGEVLWCRDLGPGVIPGMWFVPIFAFDLDGDGSDEIWLVTNENVDHPLSRNGFRLTCLNAENGETLGLWPWPRTLQDGTMSHTYRHFITGGWVNREPVLVTAQGTYRDMHLQGWSRGMRKRWDLDIGADTPGARGSHMVPVVDINQDGIDEILWGERCIELNGGRQLWCADESDYCGHSDIIQPVWNWLDASWRVYTCRESDPGASPRVVMYDARGKRIWGAVERGHIDMGWVARTAPGWYTAWAGRIGKKLCGPDGRHHQQLDYFVFDAETGESCKIGFDPYGTLPVDLDGDGIHEFVRGLPVGDDAGAIYDAQGMLLGDVHGRVALARKMGDLPGEQILVYRECGQVSLVGLEEAEDSEFAWGRYMHPYYRNVRTGGVLLGGL